MTTTTTRVTKSGAIKLGFAALATAALTIGGLSPAYAADVQLGPDQIIGFENGAEGTDGYNYDQWHIGNTENPDATVDQSLTFNECSVTFNEPVERTVTQLLKGYPIAERPTGTDTLRSVIEGIVVDVESGSVTIQLPFFERYNYVNDPLDVPGEYWTGTFRNAEPFTGGEGSISGSTALINSQWDDELLTLDEMLASMDEYIGGEADDGVDTWFELLGIGITGQPGTVVNSISFGGDTYYFGTGNCTPEVPVDPADPAAPVTPAAPKKPVAVETGF